MFYKTRLDPDHLFLVGEDCGGEEITAEEYDRTRAVIEAKPEAPEGFCYLLRTDLTWELRKLPDPEPEEV